MLRLLSWLYVLSSVLLCNMGYATPLRAWGVQQIPLLFPPGVANWLNLEDVARGGPLGVYLDTLLLGCGFNDSFNFVNWTTTGRTAELGVASLSVDMAFPVARQWQLSVTTFGRSSGGVYFVPVLSSPGIKTRHFFVCIATVTLFLLQTFFLTPFSILFRYFNSCPTALHSHDCSTSSHEQWSWRHCFGGGVFCCSRWSDRMDAGCISPQNAISRGFFPGRCNGSILGCGHNDYRWLWRLWP